jgi:hypothetical protein
LKKVIGIAIIVLFGLLVAASVFFWVTQGTSAKASTPPSTMDARYQVVTQTRVYYTDNYAVSKDSKVLTLHGYYASKMNDWIYYKADLILDKKYIQWAMPTIRPKDTTK